MPPCVSAGSYRKLFLRAVGNLAKLLIVGVGLLGLHKASPGVPLWFARHNNCIIKPNAISADKRVCNQNVACFERKNGNMHVAL